MKIDLLKKAEATIRKYNMANKSERLLVGLSGGADSAALLLCLKKLGYDICACHINHCLRGAESDRDENFCVQLCKANDIYIEVRRIDVTGYCRENSLSTEEGARILRYKAFSEIKADKICTAHNLNDCLETTVFNLARGSGLKGICSIPPVRDNIIRPLIECSRAEIEDFLAQEGQTFVTDSTNLEDEYSRNKIRHNVLPVLEKINPMLLKTYGKSLEYLRADSSFLEDTADKAYEDCKTADKKSGKPYYDCCKANELDKAVRRRVIMRMLRDNGAEVSADKICEIEDISQNGGKINIKESLFAVSRNGYLYFLTDEQLTAQPLSEPVNVPENGEVIWHGRTITFKLIEIDGKFENVNKMFANSCLDYDKIKGEIVIRQRIIGEKIQLVNRSFNSDVKKLMKEAFPVDKRNSALLLADSEGAVFVEGFGAADRVRVGRDTVRVLTFDFEKL